MTELTRRDFLKTTAGIAAAGLVSCECRDARATAAVPAARAGARGARPVVVVARDPGLARGWEVDRDRLRQLLDRAICTFGGVVDPRETWRAFYDPGDTVGIKVNTLAGVPGTTHPDLAFAVADRLASIGVERKKVVIWDRTGTDLKRGGFTLNGAGNDYRCFGTDAPGVGYEADHVSFGKVGSRLSRIVSALTAAQVNVPVIKDHGLAGISGALKSYYGAIHNPNKYHADHCDPWVADVNMLPAIRKASRLVISDGLYAQCHGGPGFKERWAWNFDGLLVGTDPVAVDRVHMSIIDSRRAELGLKTLEEDGRAPRWLERAADPEHRLGVFNLQEIERIDV